MKKNIIIIVIAAVFALGVGGAAVAIGILSMPANRVSRDMIAAERYLSEMNYEQAVIEFQKILEIKPMNVDAYIGLANSYLGTGNTEKAIEALRQGLEVTGDWRIQDMIDKLTKPIMSSTTPASSSVPQSSSSSSETPSVTTNTVTILGKEYDIATTTLNYFNLYLVGDITDAEVKEIGELVNLTELNLYNNQITDISPLANLSKLKSLNLGNNDISDITPLSSLGNLMVLNLSVNKISDISPLAGLTNLSELGLYNNEVSDFSPIENLSSLTELSLFYNPVTGEDIEVLKTQLPNCNLID